MILKIIGVISHRDVDKKENMTAINKNIFIDFVESFIICLNACSNTDFFLIFFIILLYLILFYFRLFAKYTDTQFISTMYSIISKYI